MINADKVDGLSLAAKPYYTDALPYHNWSHASSVMDAADALSEPLNHRTRRVALGALHIAAAWHDAGFHENHITLGFETKEHYSVALAERYLSEHGVDPATLKVIRTAILGTIHGAERSTINALVLHRADIANIGDEYENFYKASVALWHEHSLLSGKPISWSEHQQSSARFVDFTIKEALEELPRLGEPVGIPGAFDTNARANVARLLEEPEPPMLTV